MRPISTRLRSSLITLAGAVLFTQSPSWASVEIYDSQKQYLGALMDVHTFPAVSKGLIGTKNVQNVTQVKVMVPKLGRFLTIDATTGDFVSPDASLWFLERRCQGESYVDNALFYSIGSFKKGFITGLQTSPMPITPVSRLTIDASGTATCTTLLRAPTVWVVPSFQMDSLPFEFPIMLPLEFEYD
jgi:hypothetical protein